MRGLATSLTGLIDIVWYQYHVISIYLNAHNPEPPMPIKSPMKLQWFHILLSLVDGDLHGYAIQRAILDRTGGEMRLWPAMLYRSLATLAGEGLIDMTEIPAEDAPDERRQYYSLTAEGYKRLQAEAELMSGWVEAARSVERS